MKTKKEKKVKAILYARVAVNDEFQLPNRLLHQLDALAIYCQDNNIDIIKQYHDRASGTNFERPAFQKMLTDLQQPDGKAELLLFTTWDRFSRNFELTTKMVKRLRELGVQPKSIQDNKSNAVIINISNRLK
jgi:DNA invertase Pin-like site-specific DNA recombinase